MSSISAIGLIALGSIGAASFYVPFKKVKDWAWESYWITQGVAAWLIIPFLFAHFTVPRGTLFSIISDAPASAKWLAIIFGMLWGIGGLTFGLSIRYLGVALGQSIALGFCAAFGTIIPPLVSHGEAVSWIVIAGVAVCLAGIAVIGYAGALRSKGINREERKTSVRDFALKKGLLIAVIAGVMSSAFSFGFQAGIPIDEVALKYGTNPLFQSNPTLIFILLGGFVTNFLYCFYLNIKNKTIRNYISVPPKVLINNLFFTFLAGLLWFLQFHFYGMGKSLLTGSMVPFAWSILMALNISFSNIWGILLNEWKGAGRKVMIVLVTGILVLIASTFVVNIS